MPQLGLALCICFIVFLLYREHSRRRSLGWALWIPAAFLLIEGSRPVSVWISGAPTAGVIAGNEAERSLYDQIFYFAVLASALLVNLSSQRLRWRQVLAANAGLMLFYAFFAVSIFWSSDPSGSVKRLVKDFGLLFVIGVLWVGGRSHEAIRSVYVRCAAVLFPLSLICNQYFPGIARTFTNDGTPMLVGVTMQKNTLGEIVLILGLFLIWDITDAYRKGRTLRHTWDRWLLLAMGILLLGVSQSKTALLCLLIGAALTVRRGRLASRSVSTVALIIALSLPYIVVFAGQYRSLIAPVVEALGRNMTLTGRTDIWEHINAQTVNPLIGAGYWNFWGGPGGRAISAAMQTPVPNAHCGYLDMYLDGGVVGLAALGLLLITCGLRLARNASRSTFDSLRFAMVIVMIIYNLSETTFARITPTWFTTLLCLTEFSAGAVIKSKLRMEPAIDRARASMVLCSPLPAKSAGGWFS